MPAPLGEAERAAASYIESMLGELRSMSREIDAQFLAYLIEMAMVEANQLSGAPKSNVIAIPEKQSAQDLARMYLADKL